MVDDIAKRLRQTRANMLGTDDEAHYWDCQDAANEIDHLRALNNSLREEIRIQRKEIAALRAEQKMFIDDERPWRNENPEGGWLP